MKIALANLPYPATSEDSVARVTAAIADAGRSMRLYSGGVNPPAYLWLRGTVAC
jgi:hypothetical protein